MYSNYWEMRANKIVLEAYIRMLINEMPFSELGSALRSIREQSLEQFVNTDGEKEW